MRRTYAEVTGDPAYNTHPIEFVTGTQLYGPGYEDCDRRMPRLDNARDRLGWVPRTTLAEVLLETLSYYHERYALAHAVH